MAGEPVKFAITITDNSGQWFGHQVSRMNKALSIMGNHILNDSRAIAPKKTGAMRKAARVQSGDAFVKVVYPLVYSGYQERGHEYDGSRPVRHYTTPNTGAHYLEQTGKNVVSRGIKWFLSHS